MAGAHARTFTSLLSSDIGNALKKSKHIFPIASTQIPDTRSLTLLCVCFSPSMGSLFQWKLGSYYPASCLCLSLNRIYDVKKLAFFAPSVSSAHMSNVPPTSVCRQDKKFWLILLPGIDMAVGCLMDKQKYRLTFYWRNQEGFIRWAKSRDNIVNRDIWNKIPLSSSHLDNLPSQFSTRILFILRRLKEYITKEE